MSLRRYPGVREIEGPGDLVIISVHPQSVLDLIDDCVVKGSTSDRYLFIKFDKFRSRLPIQLVGTIKEFWEDLYAQETREGSTILQSPPSPDPG